MQFLADENVPVPSIRLLREQGLIVASVLEDAPGVPDAEVIEHARRIDAVLISSDSDIGTHVFSREVPPPPGVLYLRFVDSHPEEAAHVVLQILATPALGLKGYFTTYRNGTVRQRPLAA